MMNLSQHPRAIPYLFLTEMWERFSYYGITAILILYMARNFGIDNAQVYAIYGAYGALVYMTPLIGGVLADKYLGSFNAVVVGSILIAFGHFVVAIRDPAFHFFYLGLAIVIVGTGLFSPNINAIVGHLYKPGDSRRDNGFTLAYMGRNIGTILAPIVCAWVAARYNWRLAFVIAGMGMLVGLATFFRGRKHFSQKSFYAPLKLSLILKVLALLLALIVLVFLLIERVSLVGPLLSVVVLAMLVVIISMAMRHDAIARRRIFAAMWLTLFYIVFMILLQQSGGALNLFTDNHVDKRLWGFHIETGMFQSVEPLALVMLSPLFNRMWTSLAKKKKRLSDGVKFSLGLSIMSSSFIVMAVAMFYTSDNGQISMHWINLTYLLQAAGELFIGPIGLAMVSRLIPQKMLGLYMGVWVLGSAVANFIAAKIGAYITPSLSAGNASTVNVYQAAFFELAIIGFVFSFLLLLLTPKLKRMIAGA